MPWRGSAGKTRAGHVERVATGYPSEAIESERKGGLGDANYMVPIVGVHGDNTCACACGNDKRKRSSKINV